MVLLKQADSRGFTFYTNYESRKSMEMSENPHAALVFYWREISRSVRVLGRVERVDEKESDEYYMSRPMGSRIGAWASPQSKLVEEGELGKRVKEAEERFGLKSSENDTYLEVPRPEFWGGWRVIPE